MITQKSTWQNFLKSCWPTGHKVQNVNLTVQKLKQQSKKVHGRGTSRAQAKSSSPKSRQIGQTRQGRKKQGNKSPLSRMRSSDREWYSWHDLGLVADEVNVWKDTPSGMDLT